MTTTARVPVLDHNAGPELKEFVIFRLDSEGSRELADESNLLLEAERYASLMALSESRDGMNGIHDVHEVHYEVRRAATGVLLHTTGQVSLAIA